MTQATLLFVGTSEDTSYLPRLKSLVGTAHVYILINDKIQTWVEVSLVAKQKLCTGIISTHPTLLHKVTGDTSASINDYAGSYFRKDELEVVFIDPLAQLVSVPYGPFLTSRYVSKLASPESWKQWQGFTWDICSASNIEQVYERLTNASLLAADIETTKVNLAITSISFTAVYLESATPVLESYVFECDSDWSIAWIRKILSLQIPKVFQNGRYDCSYLLRYNCIPVNWYFDTATAFHSWYSELPKDLGFLQAFFLREGRFWKGMNESPDKMVRLEYNARDTYATAIAWCEWLLQVPSWGITNYLQEFPLNYPCLLAEMTGIKRDMNELAIARKEIDDLIATKSNSLDKLIGVTNFNVNSVPQMKALFDILGCSDLKSRDEKNLQKAAYRHPLINRIVDVIVGPPTATEPEDLGIRGLRKLKSTYLRVESDKVKASDKGAKEFHGRILYTLIPHGTDTARLASREHHFWCGLDKQNIPRGNSIKRTLVADDGFRVAECDLEQAESRDTAFIAGCEALIKAVTGERDFHSVNASAFFGVPYDSIYDQTKRKTINKAIRDLAKRVNHGANYNMGANVLVETMGLVNIYKAASILGLPIFWTPKAIAEHLLSCFHKTYPELQKVYYEGVIAEIETTGRLTSKAIHHSPYHTAGWVRKCFADPKKDKRAMNAYVAHPPQSLNAITLNKAFMKVFYEIAIHPEKRKIFRLLSQIHDSILFLFKEGHEYLAEEVRKCMEIPVTVTGYDGKERTFTVPAAIKAGKDGKGAHRWSETE